MNIYRHNFTVACPNNDLPVDYLLEIRTHRTIMVEVIVETCRDTAKDCPKPYHEKIADMLFERFGGEQTMTAFHHGVEIRTERGVI